MRIAVLPSEEKDTSFGVTRSICARLNQLGATVLAENCFQEKIGLNFIEYLGCSELFEKADMVISIGGDGAILHAAKKALRRQTPVLGINMGRLGFMTSLEITELDNLRRITSGDYDINSRMTLEITLPGKEGTYYALNDAVISRGELSRIIDFRVECNGRPVARYRSDGMIVFTPTGSTAYSLSAGGPIVDPALESIGVTPVCPHSLISRTALFEPNSCISIHPEKLEDKKAYLNIDGQNVAELKKGDFVRIVRSNQKTKLVKLKDISFYEVLSNKMMERGL